MVRPLGGGEAGSRSAPTGERQASSASAGNRAPALRGVQRYSTEENRRIRDPVRPVRVGDGGRESPSYPISGGSSNTTAEIAAAISSRSSRPPSRTP